MKPSDWESLDQNQKIDLAQSLLRSTRGRYVVGQALAIASQCLKEADHPRKEISNAEDMEVLAVLFEPWFTLAASTVPPIHPRAFSAADLAARERLAGGDDQHPSA